MSSPSPHKHAHLLELQTFGRRKGRKLSPRQLQLVDDMLPALRLDLSIDAASMPGAPSTPSAPLMPGALFADSGNARTDLRQLWLEIGFGGGEHLIWQAANNPSVGHIGCEPFLDGVVKVLNAVKDHQLTNLRLHDDDARDLVRWLPPHSIDRAFILFPDPWPKKKQQKRRLVNAATLDLLAVVMKPGAQLRIGTDIEDYARVILLAIQRHDGFVWPAKTADDWRLRPEDWPPTRYEQKAIAEGRRCCYFQFQRT